MPGIELRVGSRIGKFICGFHFDCLDILTFHLTKRPFIRMSKSLLTVCTCLEFMMCSNKQANNNFNKRNHKEYFRVEFCITFQINKIEKNQAEEMVDNFQVCLAFSINGTGRVVAF